MARLPYPDEEGLSPELRDRIAVMGRPLNIFRMMAHSPDTLVGVQFLGNTVLSRMSLEPRLRELAILAVAGGCGATYEWTQHVPIALGCGVSSEQIDALAARRQTEELFDETERAVLSAIDELLGSSRLSEPVLEGLREVLNDQEVVELLVTVGFYMLIARFLETTGVELEEGGVPGPES